jgi:ABC-type polysaccharide/polyol phosphate transport system ATPase subunit
MNRKSQTGLIQFTDVSLDYRLYRDRSVSIMETLLNVFGRGSSREWFRALDHASFQISPGESVALIGSNGAGKSSTLKLLAGIYSPSSGTVCTGGRIASLLDLGVGFHPELTGAENVFLNGALLGLNQERMLELLPQIAEFAMLERFMDTPVKYFSTGMFMRLGFALATSVEPDILLIDEVLAVGDSAFQAKCYDRIFGFREKGKTIVFVSHDPEAVRRLCARALWLDSGKIRMDGPVDDVMGAYLEENAGKLLCSTAAASPREWGNREVFFSHVTVTHGNGIPARTFRQGDSIRINTVINTRDGKRIDGIILGFSLHRPDGETVLASNNLENGEPLLSVNSSSRASVSITPEIIEPGNYLLSISLTGNDNDYHWQDFFYPVSLLGARKTPPLKLSSLSISEGSAFDGYSTEESRGGRQAGSTEST